MTPTRIFLDLDDVLNRFTMPALYHVGCQVRQLAFDDYNPEWGWDIVRAANELHPNRAFTASEFWNSLDRNFWASLPKSEEFEWLIDAAVDFVGDKNVHIISSPTLDPDCLAGKLEWIHAHMPDTFHRNYLLGPSKYLCAKPEALLIDDNENNVRLFRMHGGKAILVPRPWNSMYSFPAKERISCALADFFRNCDTDGEA